MSNFYKILILSDILTRSVKITWQISDNIRRSDKGLSVYTVLQYWLVTYLNSECYQRGSWRLKLHHGVRRTVQIVFWKSTLLLRPFPVVHACCSAWSNLESYDLSRNLERCIGLDLRRTDLPLRLQNRRDSLMAECVSACCPAAILCTCQCCNYWPGTVNTIEYMFQANNLKFLYWEHWTFV